MLRELPVRQRGACCELELSIAPAQVDGAVDVLKALADPTRLQIVCALLLATDPVCVCDFTAAFALSQPTISHHVARLRQAGLVESSRQGIWAYYRLRDDLPLPTRQLLEAAAGWR